MSTNPADMDRQYFTVAELVERERSDTEAYPWAVPQRQPRTLTPAADLLRREGVRIDGMPEPQEQDAKQHVAKLLRRENEQPQQDDKRASKVAALAGAAALSGLTIAGLIALSPGDGTPANTAADGGNDAQPGAVPIDSGTTTPSTTVLKRASSEKDQDAAKKRAEEKNGGSTTGAGSGDSAGSGGEAGDVPTTTPDAPQPAPPETPDDSPSQPPPSDDDPEPKPPEDKPKPNDPVGDVVDGVGDTVDNVGGAVGGVLDPVTGSISGTLNLGG